MKSKTHRKRFSSIFCLLMEGSWKPYESGTLVILKEIKTIIKPTILIGKFTFSFSCSSLPTVYSLDNFRMDLTQHCFICRLSETTLSANAEAEPRPVTKFTMTFRAANN
jgi:hypothetical protein